MFVEIFVQTLIDVFYVGLGAFTVLCFLAVLGSIVETDDNNKVDVKLVAFCFAIFLASLISFIFIHSYRLSLIIPQ
jgi:hypothetical protein